MYKHSEDFKCDTDHYMVRPDIISLLKSRTKSQMRGIDRNPNLTQPCLKCSSHKKNVVRSMFQQQVYKYFRIFYEGI